MSEARHQRFEIDIEEIERELRRSAQAAPAPRTDPLAELARIVGQDDPFRGILGQGRQDEAAANINHLAHAPPPPPPPAYQQMPPAYQPVHAAGDRFGSRDMAPQPEVGYDPVTDVYGSEDAALAADDMQPLRARRSRGKLAAVVVMLLATTGTIAGGLYWYRQGGTLGVAGAPPIVSADRTPVKKAPENPGGIEVPNQDRQIYERGATDGKSRVVDGREQPIDVREAARSMPAVTDRPPTVSARAPVTGPPLPGTAARDDGLAPSASQVAPASPPSGSAVSAALGEPRRVRTVAVRPDGSVYTPSSTASLAGAPPSLLPGNTPPAPIPVTTVSVQNRPGATSAALVPAAAVPAGPAPAVSPALSDQSSPASTEGSPARAAVKVLPPARPKTLEKPVEDAAVAEAPARTASVQPNGSSTRAGERASERTPAAESASGNFTVQIAVRPTEEEARSAYTQLQDKFAADLDGKPAKVTRGEANGKTVHRVRVGPMTKADATALCTKLKSSGGSCFIANN